MTEHGADSPKALATERVPSRSSKIDWGEKVIIVMIGVEILLSLATICLTVYEANGQDKRLGNILTAQQKVDTDLSERKCQLKDLDSVNNENSSFGTVQKVENAARYDLILFARSLEHRLRPSIYLMGTMQGAD